ncbi:class III poly(R)-hydroxyalkanoic acid synthase subunit PhaE [Pseudoxanthomonas dokdonensis]|uniref:class III poly(R)-hydroxyalkanoic acid synthase subunit PhaE n=1 Tax=Pseudoxanthomonas dokdonensis TaxID=344882 RepID=UPI00070B97E2|nr:class III poly(R)-hydroxyalkanoic acid synthase subunit PhaE [Pseudoxanthomonas dokdonensis]
MINSASSWPGDLDNVARQYWTLWGDALRQAGIAPAPAPSMTPDWQQQAMGFWSQFMPKPANPLQDAVDRIQHQAGQWYAQMQQVAAQFAGQQQAPADIAQAWREALGGGAGPEAFAGHFRSMLGQGGGQGMEQWMQQARPYIEALERENARWLHAPTFGLSREHQERWQALALAQQEYQRHSNEFNALMLKTADGAFKHFEALLAQHAEPDKQITSARGLFDLWIDAAEQSYAEIAMTDEFRHVYGAMTNAQMRVRLAVQRETEQLCGLLGVPTRTEVDAAHRKIVELERLLRRQARAAGTGAGGETSQRPAAANAPRPRSRPAAARSVAKPAGKAKAVKKAGKTASRAKPAPASKPAKAPAAPSKRAATGKRASASRNTTATATKKAAAPAATRSRSTAATAGKSKSAKTRPAAATSSVKDWVARNQAGKPARGSRR